MADNIGKPARRPRAVMVSRLFRPEPAAASLALGAIADGLVREGFDVTVLTSRAPQEFEVRDDPGLTVRRAPSCATRPATSAATCSTCPSTSHCSSDCSWSAGRMW